MRLTISKCRAEVDTGRTVTAKEWNAKAQEVRGSAARAAQINLHLKGLDVAAWGHYHALGPTPTAAKVKALLTQAVAPAPVTLADLSDRWHAHVAAPAQDACKNTVRTFGTRRNELARWLKLSKQKALLAVDVRPRHALAYEQHLLGRGSDPVTVRRYVAWLRQVLDHGVLLDLLEHNPLTSFKSAKGAPKPPPVFLPEAAVEQLWKANFASTAVAQAVDAWLFCKETGLIWADYRNFDPAQHLHTDEAGVRWIRMVRQKMRKRKPEGFSVPLTPRALSLLERYRYRLPAVGGTSGNKALLQVEQSLGLSVHLTWKVARSTFAQYWSDRGVSDGDIGAMMGDTEAVVSKHYARVREQRILAALGPLMDIIPTPGPPPSAHAA